MHDDQASNDITDQLAGQPSPGQRLKAAREAVAMSHEDVCRELKMMASQVKAIEEDRFNDLPGDAFVRGYLRGYAALVGISTDEIVTQYKALRGDDAKLVGVEPTPRVVWPKQLAMVVIVGAVLGAVAVGVFKAYEYYSRQPTPIQPPITQQDDFSPATTILAQSEETQANAEQALQQDSFDQNLDAIDLEEQAEPSGFGDGELTDAQLAVLMNEAQQVSAQLDGESLDGEVGTDSADIIDDIDESERQDSVEDKVIGSGRDSLVLTFTEQSWVRVRDEASLELILNEIISAGQVVRVRHTGVMDIRLGYAPGVQVRFNGEPVTFRIRQDTNTAKFTVGGE